MFRAMVSPIIRSTRLCVYSLWYNAPTMLPTGNIMGALYHQQSSASEDERNHRPKHVELTGIINKPLLLHPVGGLYYLKLW